jgi:hypothetical protein
MYYRDSFRQYIPLQIYFILNSTKKALISKVRDKGEIRD